MIDISQLIHIVKSSEVPVYIQIAERIAELIQEGLLPGGIKIQTTRDLALQMKVNRNTVVAAYNELINQKWLEVRKRKGFYVSKVSPHINPVLLKEEQTFSKSSYPTTPGFEVGYGLLEELTRKYPTGKFRYVFTEGFPDVRLTPLKPLLKEYQSLFNRKMAYKYLSYSSKLGSNRLREELCKTLRQTRGLPVNINNIMVTKGAQMAIYLAGSLLIKPGDAVVVGEPNYFIVNAMFKRLGANLCPIPVDENGIDVDLIEKLCEQRKIRVVYVIPHHHHPTTVTLSKERRLKLLQLAQKHQFAIIEDDFDFDLHFENRPTLPMASFDPQGSVIYIGTLSKVLAPAIRIGFIVAPLSLINLLAQHRFMIDLQGDNLLEESIAELYKNGSLERHLKKIRNLYKERRDLLCRMLNEHLNELVSFTIPKGGMCLWLRFKGIDTRKISEACIAKGVFIDDGKRHNTGTIDYNAICIGYASMNLQELEQATNVLIDVVREEYSRIDETTKW